ncbi:uncharacterized protein At2g39795, mitochondrial-like [Andrographis paniculata]|uniref:uncharacterized protein At2g39795, mitochondrial-like n=1 Tax=Andrographis paniculata TaxID=175694 RepID=UPI0021E6F13D|nr:uncharacterized protein At2g39795, mitochondrial-like [Andrographis paniculata]XP_051148030.1 uncharacterized protein At2g39795, mitochondrial-like [Andrographis paniculata]
MAHRLLLRGLRGAVRNLVTRQQSNPLNYCHKSSIRNYVSEMRKSAFEGNILRLIRNEIQYELERSPPSELVGEFNSFTIDECRGEQWIRLSKKYSESEEIKIDVTMFDGSVPVEKYDGSSEDVKLHITLIVDIFKGESSRVLEFLCSAWPDSIEIRNVFTRDRDQMKMQPHMGPEFKELSDELQDSLYEFLESRGVDDKLAEFVHLYMRRKDESEYVRWMENLKSFIQKK